jgi:hypothetical protein
VPFELQDNKPLMEALSKLIDVNRPDLCLFVGEALVGNDAVDQLKKFNQSLADMSTQVCPGACCRTEGYTHDANVWDLSIVQGPFLSPSEGYSDWQRFHPVR